MLAFRSSFLLHNWPDRMMCRTSTIMEYILSILEDGLPVPLPKIKLTVTSAGQSEIYIESYAVHPQQTFQDDLSNVVQPKKRSHLGTVSPVEVS